MKEDPRRILEESGTPDEDNAPGDPVGVVFGNVGSDGFKAVLSERSIREMDYLQVFHPTEGRVLAIVESVELRSDLDQERALRDMSKGGGRVRWNRVAAVCIVGLRDSRGTLIRPLTPVLPLSRIYRPEEDFIKEVLGLELDRENGAYIGKIMNTTVDVVLDPELLVQRHVSIVAKTGSGKSYTCGVMVEELHNHSIPVVILDLHGEYRSLVSPNIDADEYGRMDRFGISPKGIGDDVIEFTFGGGGEGPTLLGLDVRGYRAEELLELMGLRNIGAGTSILYNAISRAREVFDGEYELDDLLAIVESDPNPAKWGVRSGLEHLMSLPVFSSPRTPLTEVVVPGKVTLIDMKDAPMDLQQVGTAALLRRLFEARKESTIPPFMLIVEEAHNFCPQSGPALTSRVLRSVASEGRKFGMGLTIVTQRPAKVDKNVLSQCGTQIIMKVTNPNDLKAVISSVEGLDSRTSDEIQRLPVSTGIVVGGNVATPILVEIRIRRTRHGGDAVDILGDIRMRGQ